MLKKSFNSLLTTWLAGLLVMLPLVLTLALLAWVVSLLNRFVGPSSLIGRGFAAIGQPLAGDSPLAYLLGTALLLVAIYLLGLGVQLGLKRPLANLFDLTLRRTPLIGNLYNLADRFVGLLDKKQDADIAAMSPVWCFFGGDQVAVLALLQAQLFAGDQDLALVRVLQQVDAAQEGGFARAGRSEDGDHVAVAGGEGDALEHFEVAVALVQVTDFQCGGGLACLAPVEALC